MDSPRSHNRRGCGGDSDTVPVRPKEKICKICGQPFKPMMTTAKVCGWKCAMVLARDKRAVVLAKEKRKRLREGRESLKTRSDHLRQCQATFNAYIRTRDAGMPCISCGTTKNVQYCAGHYLTRGAYPELRFHEMNVHLQCNQFCNLQNSGNIRKYRINLIGKIGLSNVDWLEGKHQPQKWTIDDIKEIRAYYKQLTKELP